MNNREKVMLNLLRELRDDYGAISVKAEFEAEGTRTDELLRLIDLARRADLNVALKIGGCEAVRDLLESKQFGVEYIIAPMVETPYALSKFIQAKNKVYSSEEAKHTDFLFNLETKSTFDVIDDMINLGATENGIQGIVFGRVDFSGSLALGRTAIDEDQVTDYVLRASTKAKKRNLDFVVGGGVAISSLGALKTIYENHLSRFETRKIIFQSDALSKPLMASGLEKTVFFELQWLKNKRDYYAEIQNEDNSRIEMLEKRWSEISK